MAVMAMLLLFLSNLAGGVARAYQVGKGRSEANNLGRALLDSMANDVKQAIVRSDMKFLTEENSASSRAIKFYTKRPGTFRSGLPGDKLLAPRSASIVEYIFYRTGANQGYLARRDRPSTWDSSRATIATGNTNTIASLDSGNEETRIYEGIVGLDCGFVRADGSVDGSLSASTNAIIALRISVAVVDRDTLELLKSMDRVNDFMRLFGPTGTTENLGIRQWHTTLDEQGGIYPGRILQGVRFYERTIPLGNPSQTL